MNKNGIILFEGISAIDGKTPIVAIATGLKNPSSNGKIGARTIQVWYLLRDISPVDAVKTGEDHAVCGDCKHRPVNGGACYVITFQAPRAVWKAYHNGSYAHWDGDTSIFEGRTVRFGAWGDPASVPVGTFDDIREASKKVLAYTHQWEDHAFESLRSWAMASVDSVAERVRAKASGFRTFRVRSADEPIEYSERMCPSADESPIKAKMDCDRCNGCDGIRRGAKRPDYTIIAHGRGAASFSA